MTTLDEALERLPKVELHCHIEGTMRPATVLELARKNGIALPTTDLDELYRYDSLDGFLTVFWLVQSCLASREDWARLAYESVVDGAAHGRVYAESFFTPARHLAAGQRLGDIVAGLAEGIEAAEHETGARCMLIADIDRAYGAAAGLELVEGLTELRRTAAAGSDRVIGLGLDSTELGVDPRSFAPAYRAAAAVGLRLTAHQGEDTGPDAIAACVDVLGAQRIDHGLSIMGDDALVRRFAAERIPLTVCPTSNVVIANRVPDVAHHPFAQMRSAGLLATLNTDDPALTDLDLGREYRAVAAAYGWDFDTMVRVSHDGVDGTWLDDDGKRRLHREIDSTATALRPTTT
ncbi:MAG TPA: adenosine deaminase [Acidimicrobiales bacterium]|nr:adenosine deaminase [Acidimicrobiales bacterium]